VTNRGKDRITFRIALARRVEVDGRGGPGPLRLSRGKATLVVAGVDKVSDSDDGRVLEVEVAGRSTKQLTLAVGGP
jgi:hypothetical protein